MSEHKHSLFQAMMARISLGAVPVDGVYWFDPRSAKLAAGRPQSLAGRSIQPAPDQAARPATVLRDAT